MQWDTSQVLNNFPFRTVKPHTNGILPSSSFFPAETQAIKLPPLSVPAFSFLSFPRSPFPSSVLHSDRRVAEERRSFRQTSAQRCCVRRRQMRQLHGTDSYTHIHEHEHKMSAPKDSKIPQSESFHFLHVCSLTQYTQKWRVLNVWKIAEPWKCIRCTSRHVYLCEIKRLNPHYKQKTFTLSLTEARHERRLEKSILMAQFAWNHW